MKTFGTFIYRLALLAMMLILVGTIYNLNVTLEKIATETRISNEMTMCIEDPHCTLDNEN